MTRSAPPNWPKALCVKTLVMTLPIIMVVLFCGSTLCQSQTLHQHHKQLNSPKQTSANKQPQEPPVDDLIKDTMLLLDSLDQKLTTMTNETAQVLLRKQRDLSPSEAHMDNPESDDQDDDELSVTKQARQLQDQPSTSTSASSDSTDRHIKFTLSLMQAMFASNSYTTKSQSIESFLISPLSIQMVLMMMHLGAKGQTRREIANCLHLQTPTTTPSSSDVAELAARVDAVADTPSKPKRRQSEAGKASMRAHDAFGAATRNLLKDSSVTKALTNANQIFLQKTLSLSSQYEWAIRHYYGADIQLVNFQLSGTTNSSSSNSTSTQSSSNDVQKLINDWVERQSKGKISQFITAPIPASTLMMAINVLYFKGDWQYKFDPADTQSDSPFTLANGKLVKVPMMVSRLPLAYAHNPQMKTSVVELPYKAQRLGLFILLPDEVSGIYNTMSMLNSSSFAGLISSMRKVTPGLDLASNGLNVRIPKFNIDSQPRLSQILSQQLGLKSLFSPDVADLSGMFANTKQRRPSSTMTTNKLVSGDKENVNASINEAPAQVGLDELVHKAILQVDEHGSVAAATSATIVERVGVSGNNYFEADHPFLLFLMDKQTGLVLFSGVYAGPTQPSTDTQNNGNPPTSTANATTTGDPNQSHHQQQQHHHHHR